MSNADARTPNRGLPRTAGGRAKRQAIIDAAAELMYKQGVNATSVDEVLAASGAGKSQLYHYFTGKTDLVRSVVERQLDVVLGGQPRLGSIRTWSDLQTWARELLAIHHTPAGALACPLGTLAAEIDRDPALRPVVAAAFANWQTPLASAFSALQHNGAVRRDIDPQRLAIRTLVVLQGGMLLAATFDDPDILTDSLNAHLQTLTPPAVTPAG